MKNVLENKLTKMSFTVDGDKMCFAEILAFVMKESNISSSCKIKDLRTEIQIIDILVENKNNKTIQFDKEQVAFLKNRFSDEAPIPPIKHSAIVDAINAVQAIEEDK